jgi:hypothetical protein
LTLVVVKERPHTHVPDPFQQPAADPLSSNMAVCTEGTRRHTSSEAQLVHRILIDLPLET